MECVHPKYIAKNDVTVPCGSCAFCAATKRSDWALRLYYEAKKHYGSKFITLTYNNNHLTYHKGSPQLVKADLQNWFKRVRKAGYKMRYFAVGEYGSKTYRPHYHVIVFGDVPESVLTKAWSFQNKKTKKYYAIGHCHIGTVTQASIMYCLGYIVNGKGWKMRVKRIPPFTLMSRNPGLGANYLSPAMRDWHKSGRKNYAIVDGQKRHLPRYYKTKIFSRIDLVRIAVRDGKQAFKKAVEWIRHPKRMKMRDPLAYRDEQLRRLAKRIKLKCKENLTI